MIGWQKTEAALHRYLDGPSKDAICDNVPEHPAVYHMLDVAAVTNKPIGQRKLGQPLSQAHILLPAAHDLAKIENQFGALLQHPERLL